MSDPGQQPNDAETRELFRRLAELVYDGDDYDRVYTTVCAAAPNVVEGCDHASLMLRQGTELVTAAASDEVARRIDDLERLLREGPCVDAIEQDDSYVEARLVDGSRWPQLAERVLTETPVRGMVGFRLSLGDGQVGALNLFSRTPDALTEQSLHEGMVLASFVSVSAYAAAERRSAATLREGLASNREIGKAVGLMMAFHRISDQEAFEVLRKASQDMNIKVTEVARQVVEHHNDGRSGNAGRPV